MSSATMSSTSVSSILATLTIALLAGTTLAGPLNITPSLEPPFALRHLHRRQATTMCGQTPTSADDTSTTPFSSPAADTAEACQAQCEADTDCESFVFGLGQDDAQPECILFDVPADEVPAQGDGNLEVFDVGCTGVPTGTPTQSDPVGETGSPATGNGGTGEQDGGITGDNAGNANGNGNGDAAGGDGGEQDQGGNNNVGTGGQQ
ncbi:hypothetical protein MKZ38_003356 [Zalerion maritima]|uniref:Apple domain-containing protein n=1 Tax=Zalerion maritima TaxID=339359 RepID=A0AAD5WQB2_9PEZI|nr:hypothetical protein MKZ38_003356 [Zalerion maritima]